MLQRPRTFQFLSFSYKEGAERDKREMGSENVEM